MTEITNITKVDCVERT